MEKRLLQTAVAVGGLVPVGAGAAGALLGPAMLGADVYGPASDSHFRYLSGLLLGIGLAYWSMIPRIERRTALFTALSLIVVLGGLARLLGLLLGDGEPEESTRWALLMELVVTPALCLWQRRVAGKAGAAP
jgi:hypothetical protein